MHVHFSRDKVFSNLQIQRGPRSPKAGGMSPLHPLGGGEWTVQGLDAYPEPIKGLPDMRHFTIKSLTVEMESGKKDSELARDQRLIWLGDSGVLVCMDPPPRLSDITQMSSMTGIGLPTLPIPSFCLHWFFSGCIC